MRTLLNAVLSYGLVNVPVGIATAAKRKDAAFKTLHKGECLGHIGQSHFCKTCGEVVSPDETVKGFEFAKNQFVVVPDEELEILKSERSKVIRINKFVAWDDLDEVAMEKNYFLKPPEVREIARGYSILSQAMLDTQSIAIGTSSLWGKEYPSLVWVRETGTLVLSPLFCADEIVDDAPVGHMLAEAIPTEQEREMARELVVMLRSQFNPQEDLRSDARDRVQEYLASKITGGEFEFAPPSEEPKVETDFMAQLTATLNMEKERVA